MTIVIFMICYYHENEREFRNKIKEIKKPLDFFRRVGKRNLNKLRG